LLAASKFSPNRPLYGATAAPSAAETFFLAQLTWEKLALVKVAWMACDFGGFGPGALIAVVLPISL
jgi:hypothetical protein